MIVTKTSCRRCGEVRLNRTAFTLFTDASTQVVSYRFECPYCGVRIDVLIDPSDDQQSYIEDCQVCCRPIEFAIATDPDGDIAVGVASDSE